MSNLSHSIRKFNRFELKYIVSVQAAVRFKLDLSSFLAPDEHGSSLGSYGVSSLYYDSPDYHFYWEKIDGIKFRRKLRIRHYENSDVLTEDTPVFSDDDTIASQLPDYLDVESFATYLAINNLLVNTDSMTGMGNNFYFYYDNILSRMTVLYWDGNESLSKLGGGPTYDLYF
jgi:hypothetical protein